jgi:hypothetical protein
VLASSVESGEWFDIGNRTSGRKPYYERGIVSATIEGLNWLDIGAIPGGISATIRDRKRDAACLVRRKAS